MSFETERLDMLMYGFFNFIEKFRLRSIHFNFRILSFIKSFRMSLVKSYKFDSAEWL